MPKELVVVPGAVTKKTVITDDGYELPIYEQTQSPGHVAMSLWPNDWFNVRTHASGVHVCEQVEQPETDSDWEAVVFG
ncbi:hypothetical protein [Loktanella sp. S4079]|uniref:hypothetical protein n=1 Tax=Loktanella sp. S4079 TaxID=579483 RepID=UPI0005F9D4A4|nr:hypothetical protein [Loktanella sp. S4079]KJZ17915.1 hypothetical protein TW80_16375 [Loktanella sp. S4079]